MHPAQRIHDLRKKGLKIDTIRIKEETPCGRKTTMALYVLRMHEVNNKGVNPKTDPSIEDTIGRQPVAVHKENNSKPHFTGPDAADHYLIAATYSAFLRITENPVAASILALTATMNNRLEVLVNNVSGIDDTLRDLAHMADEATDKHVRGVCL
jgi:hypothetical protein